MQDENSGLGLEFGSGISRAQLSKLTLGMKFWLGLIFEVCATTVESGGLIRLGSGARCATPFNV